MHVEVSVDIPAPIELVWNTAQNPSLRTKWDQRVARYEIHGPVQAGTPVTITLKVGPFRPTARGQLLRWAPPFQSVLRSEPVRTALIPAGAGSWTFAEIPTGTRVTTRFSFDERHLHPLIPRRLYRAVVEWDTRRSFGRLRTLVLSQLHP